jgi:hypothetical protein
MAAPQERPASEGGPYKKNKRGRRKAAPKGALPGFEEFAEDGRGVFAEFAVVGAEGGEEVGVDVEFADDFAADEDGDDDFGFGFERAGEVAGVGVDVIDDDGFAAGSCGAADALVERNAGVGRHGAFEGAEDERVASFPFEQVETDPVVAGEFFMEKRDDGLHEGFAGGGGFGERVELGNDVGRFGINGGHGFHSMIYLTNGVGSREECPQGLKPSSWGPQMSELKLRPLKAIYEMTSSRP